MVSNDPSRPSDAPSRAGSLPLVGGALALDFANTAGGRGSPHPVEHLRDPTMLLAWAEHAGILDSESGRHLRAACARDRAYGEALFADAIALREAIHAVATAIAEGERPPEVELTRIKDACARAIASGRLAPGEGGFAWTWPTDPPVPDTLLGPIALSAVGVMRDGDLSRLKRCAGEHCGWVFFDLTKNRGRRWCEMSVCGNRAKARRFTARAVTGTKDR
jgi:predicted RNA-binding Zn ribbon-like protein